MKKYLITGLLIWIPLAITIWVLDLIVSTMDQSLLLLPPQYQPQVLFGYQIPGVGALLTVVVVFVTGVLASNILGQRLLSFWENVRGDYVSVYVPTTPNPTSGFFLMMPRAEVIELDMSVDEALRYVISMGVAAPDLPGPRKL